MERKTAVGFAFGKMVVMGIAKGALAVVLDFANWASFIGKQVPDISAIVHSERALKQAATTPPAAPRPLSCPGATTFFNAFNKANGPRNTMDYYNIVRGPKCVSGWAASYGTTGVNGSGHELTRCGWVVLRERSGAWVYYEFTFQFTQPCNPSSPDTSVLKQGSLKMCSSDVPAAIRDFLGC